MPSPQKKMLLAGAALLSLMTLGLFAKYFTDLGGGRFGGDFLTFWQAGQRVFQGAFAALYNPDYWRHVTPENAPPLITWLVYPPFALFGLWPLGALDYGPAVLAWSLAPLPLYFALMVKLARRSGLPPIRARADFLPYLCLAASTLPFLTANIMTGQTGGFIAVCFLGAIYFWGTRPILAGICIGLIAVKPQMGILFPLALLAARQWRTIFSAAATILVLSIAATVWLGVQIWADYVEMTGIFGRFIGQDYQGIKRLAVGPYVSLIAAGSPPLIAAIVQAVLTLTIAVLIVRLFWRRRDAQPKDADGRGDLRLGMLAAGALLATPYAQSYDTPLLIIAIAPLFARGWRSGFSSLELTALAALVLVPLAQPALIQSGVPFGFLAVAGYFMALYSRYTAHAAFPAAARPIPAV